MAPFLRKIPPFSSTYKSGMKLRESLHDEIREEIKRHQETLDLDNPRDFIDHFLNEMNKHALHNDGEHISGCTVFKKLNFMKSFLTFIH